MGKALKTCYFMGKLTDDFFCRPTIDLITQATVGRPMAARHTARTIPSKILQAARLVRVLRARWVWRWLLWGLRRRAPSSVPQT